MSFTRLSPWLGVTLFLGIFFFYPLARILWLGLNPISLLTLTRDSFLLATHSLLFTFFQASLSTLLTLLLGLPAAYLFSRFDFHGKSLLRLLTAIPFMLPTVVVATGFNALLGPRGWINLGLMRLFGLDSAPIVFVYTLWAILLAHVFYNTTIVIRVVGNALAHLDPRLEQAARSLGADGHRALWRITLPLLRPSILASTLLIFLFDFTSFGVILLLGGPRFSTLEVEIYIQAIQIFNLPLAAVLSLIQLLCTLMFSALYSRFVIRATIATDPRAAASNLHRARTWHERLFVGGMIILLLILFLLPMASLPLRSVIRMEPALGERTTVHYGLTGDYYAELFVNRLSSLFYVPPFHALTNSLLYATATVILSLVLAFPVASALARPGRMERFLDPLLMLPLGASAVTLGLGLIITFNKPLLNSQFSFITSPLLVPLAHTIIALPFVIRSLQPALASIPDRVHQAAATLGASPRRVWFTVDWPIVARATLAAAIFAFTTSLGEFGATSLVYRPSYPTLPIAIYRFLSQPGGLNYGQAMAMATILMIVCGAGILAFEKVRLPGTGEF